MYDQDVKYKKIAIGLVALHDVNLGVYILVSFLFSCYFLRKKGTASSWNPKETKRADHII